MIFDAVYYQDSEDGAGASALIDAPGISGGHGHAHDPDIPNECARVHNPDY